MLLVIDGAVDVPGELERTPSVEIVSSEVWLGAQRFRGDRAAFWARLRAGERFATEPPGIDALRAAYERGDHVVGLHVSAELSTTVERARAAAAQLGGSVAVVDSRSLSVGAGLIATALQRAMAEGQGPEAVADLGRSTREHLHTFVVVADTGTLRHSERAGLLPSGHLVRGRPLLLAVRGRAVALDQVRDRGHAVRKLVDHALDAAPAGVRSWALGHGDAGDVADVRRRLAERFGCDAAFETQLDPAVGAHVGADAIVVGVLS